MTTFTQIWSEIANHTVLNRYKAANICKLLKLVVEQGLEGDVAECGVYKGGVSLLMALTLMESLSAKVLHMYDSFEGLPDPNSAKDLPYYRKGALRAGLQQVNELLAAHGAQGNASIHPGWFESVLPLLPPTQKFCFLHIDCDLYESTKICLNELYDRVVEGGIVVFDDYFDIGGGERLAVDEFLSEHGGELLFAGPTEQVFFFKGRRCCPSDSRFLVAPSSPQDRPVSLEHLLADLSYKDALAKGELMAELPGGSLKAAARLAEQTLKVYSYHQLVLQRMQELERGPYVTQPS